jgi:biotin/methionine sulfoxide reductase
LKTRSLTHWGLYDFEARSGRIVNVTPAGSDPDPSPIGRNLINGNAECRIASPAVRRQYLEKGPGHGTRGDDEYVQVTWVKAIALIAAELQRVRASHGNAAIYGGSYGWASAGRFHHAQSQLHRFLNCIGGYTESVNAYSFAAAEVILPHVIGRYDEILKSPGSWPTIIEHCELMVCFGGLPLRNSQITNGGMAHHVQKQYMQAAYQAGVKFISISPMRDDTADDLAPEWLAVRPGTDVALMLGIAHTIYVNGWHDQSFLDRYCHGFGRFSQYLVGESDGIPKTAAWAAQITGIPADLISALGRRMTARRTMISISWSLSRQQHGEQPYWMGITLAAMIGQMGLPGRGIGLGYGVENKVGKNVQQRYYGHLSRGPNPARSFIPVARITDMLNAPGQEFRYNGKTYQYPDIKLIYWAGGNPFHHHQDLNRLRAAWQKPDTVICHELTWNSLARHSDIVLPAASSLERNDIGGAPNENFLCAMKQVVPPFGEAQTDYSIFSTIARELKVNNEFTEGRTEMDWVEHLYQLTQKLSPDMPGFDEFWHKGSHTFPDPKPHTLFEKFRHHPANHALGTPSGKIQIFSDAIAGFDEELHAHSAWYEPTEWLGSDMTGHFPLHLISHQPPNRLHSQLDHGEYSQEAKIRKREPVRVNPIDAKKRRIDAGDVVRVFNDRGSFLAGAELTDSVLPGVIHIATGAWWDPDENGLCKHGNPNAVTLDTGTSVLSQGPSALTCLVEVEKYTHELPEMTAYVLPI